ncbi:uncharacterized protein cubi_03145 [Cryptosporidium ubiquitum]|uniref:Uncharacterized protein n=1 Tax=Cryptosporidium ubiquitum TaxID=857276 RepID=A0A1J4MNK1_9CRYT|nr:uncharacterized protein cubi_03145 [Cryptosporidium ubiquitum]OII75035.1 hypothetical protein cubi_03145 [Cryptosporidium ubiquitum]
MEEPRITYSDDHRSQAEMFVEAQNQVMEGELSRGLYVSTEVETNQSSACGIACGPKEQRLTHTIRSFTRPIPVTAGQMKLNSADELIGKPVIKQRLNEMYVNRSLKTSPTNKFLSFGVASMRTMNSNPQPSYRSTGSGSMSTSRSYTYLSHVNTNNYGNMNTGISQYSREFTSNSSPVFNVFTTILNGFCSCPGFISACNNKKKIHTIEQEQIPSDSDFADSGSESDDDAGLDVAQEEQN